MTDTDAIVIGSGINGLVAAAELAQDGWSVLLLERNPQLGGFIATEERTLPGYRHDTYSSWHPLFVTGPAYARLGPLLHKHGLAYRNTDGVLTASVSDSGRIAVAHRDPAVTVAQFDSEADRSAYLTMLSNLDKSMPAIGGLLGAEVRSPTLIKHAAWLVRHNGFRATKALLRTVAMSGRGFTRQEFHGPEVDHLFAPWLLHAGLAPDQASGGLMIPLLAATLHGAGLPTVAGGAGEFVAAFRSLLESLNVQIRTGTEVEQILVEGGRAIGAVAGGEKFRARRAVIASVTPTALYGKLLPPEAVDPAIGAEAAKFRYGRAAMQIHVALSAPLSWTEERLREVPLIHMSDGSASTAIACAEAEAGLLPRRPTVVVGQQYLLDPSRVPDGAAALWLQLQEVPFSPQGDAADLLDTSGGWTEALAKGYAERILDRIAKHAPDLREKLLVFDTVTPTDLALYNPNAVYGDPYGGSGELDQNFAWRPLPSAGRHAGSVAGLWHIGASTHPGPGLGGGAGHIVATALTRRFRRR